jgi:hypothetical protein
MFLRLCVRAPRMLIARDGVGTGGLRLEAATGLLSYSKTIEDLKPPINTDEHSSMRVGQGPRLLALAGELVGHFGVHLTKPAVEFSLQAPDFALLLLVGQTRQRAEVVLELLHQPVAFDQITVAVHIGSRGPNSKTFHYRLLCRDRTTSRQLRGWPQPVTHAVRDIVCSLGFSGSSKVAILRVYGDAGGNRDKTNVAVGAYLGTADQWDNWFRPLWDAELKNEGVGCFHRSDMEPPFYGQFRGKSWTTAHQIPVLNRLHKIVREHTLSGIGQAVSNAAFARLMPAEIQQKYGGPYGWGVLRTIVWFGTLARKRDEWVHYFFEAGDRRQAQIDQAISELSSDSNSKEWFRIASWTFAPKKGPQGVMQLQAGDFIAFEAYKAVHNYESGSPRAQRKSFDDLLRPPPQDLVLHWTDEALRSWLLRLDRCDGDVIEALIDREYVPRGR